MQTLWGEFIAWDYLYIAGSVMFSGGPSWETFGFLFYMMKLDLKNKLERVVTIGAAEQHF